MLTAEPHNTGLWTLGPTAISISGSTSEVQTKISHQLFDGLPWHFVQTFIFPWLGLWMTVSILCLFCWHHHKVGIVMTRLFVIFSICDLLGFHTHPMLSLCLLSDLLPLPLYIYIKTPSSAIQSLPDCHYSLCYPLPSSDLKLNHELLMPLPPELVTVCLSFLCNFDPPCLRVISHIVKPCAASDLKVFNAIANTNPTVPFLEGRSLFCELFLNPTYSGDQYM